MKKVSLLEHKKLALDILLNFDSVCRSNNISYSLAYGTLLGAIRHFGFIPWDDDIDVIVSRKDYRKLGTLLNQQLDNRYRFVDVASHKKYSAPLAKIIDTHTLLVQRGHASEKMELGVYIDIFVYDSLPSSKWRTCVTLKKARLLQKIWSFCSINYNNHSPIINKIRAVLCKTPLSRLIALYIEHWASTRNHNESEQAAILTFGFPDAAKNLINPFDFQDTIDYIFEGHSFLGVKNYDYYLTLWYGDYMTPPSVENQISNHSVEVCYKEINKLLEEKCIK